MRIADSSDAVQFWRSKNKMDQKLIYPCQLLHQPCLDALQLLTKTQALTKLQSKWNVTSNEMQKLATNNLLHVFDFHLLSDCFDS